MKEFYFETPIRDGEPLYKQEDLDKVDELCKEFDGQSLEWTVRTPEEIRRLRANRYYRGAILPEFVPKHFQAEYEVHNHFTEKYLSQVDVIDLREDDFEKVLYHIGKMQSKSRNTIKKTKIEDNIYEIRWVRSTSTLTKKQFANYVNSVTLEGQELGLEFKPIEQFNEYK